MAFKSLIFPQNNRGCAPCRDVKNELGYSFHQRDPEAEAKSKNASRVNFYIGNALLKEARFLIGDRLDLMYDPDEGLGLIRRVTPTTGNGRKLSKGGGTSSSCGVFGFKPLPDEARLFSRTRSVISLENVSVEDQGILFAWPKPQEQTLLALLSVGKIQPKKK